MNLQFLSPHSFKSQLYTLEKLLTYVLVLAHIFQFTTLLQLLIAKIIALSIVYSNHFSNKAFKFLLDLKYVILIIAQNFWSLIYCKILIIVATKIIIDYIVNYLRLRNQSFSKACTLGSSLMILQSSFQSIKKSSA